VRGHYRASWAVAWLELAEAGWRGGVRREQAARGRAVEEPAARAGVHGGGLVRGWAGPAVVGQLGGLLRAGQARRVVEVSEGRSDDQQERGEAGSRWSGVDLRKARAGFSRWAGFSRSEGQL
jgi:hypothetical protein